MDRTEDLRLLDSAQQLFQAFFHAQDVVRADTHLRRTHLLDREHAPYRLAQVGIGSNNDGTLAAQLIVS